MQFIKLSVLKSTTYNPACFWQKLRQPSFTGFATKRFLELSEPAHNSSSTTENYVIQESLGNESTNPRLLEVLGYTNLCFFQQPLARCEHKPLLASRARWKTRKQIQILHFAKFSGNKP